MKYPELCELSLESRLLAAHDRLKPKLQHCFPPTGTFDMPVNVSSSLVQQLMEIGYLATGGGMAGEASTVFAAIEAVRPQSELPLVGQGVTHLNAGKTSEGIAVLRKALEKNPDSEFAATFLGLALMQAGLTHAAENLLGQVKTSGKDPRAINLADSLLSGE